MGPSEGNSQASRGWVSQAFVCKLLTPGLSAKSACPSLPRRASVQLYFLPSKGDWGGACGKKHSLSEPLSAMPELPPLFTCHHPQKVLLSA